MLYIILCNFTGRQSDMGVLSHSVFGKALETNTLSIPPGSSGMLAISHTGSNRYVNNVPP